MYAEPLRLEHIQEVFFNYVYSNDGVIVQTQQQQQQQNPHKTRNGGT